MYYLKLYLPLSVINSYVFFAEVMGALLSVLLIWVVTGVLVYMAVERVISQDFEIDASVMLITAGISVAFNIA